MTELPDGFYKHKEREDALGVLRLLESERPGQPLSTAVTDELQEIATRGPKPDAGYEARRQVGDTLYIKAWPGEEDWYRYAYEEHDLDPTVAHVVCVPAAYPVAWLVLARQLDGSGDAEMARKFAEVSLALEEHPATLCDLGAMVGAEGEHETALGLFARAFDVREDVAPWLKARAALGVGVTLLEDGQLDKAEEAIKVALQLEPDSEVAQHALRYVEEARGEAGGYISDDTVSDRVADEGSGDE